MPTMSLLPLETSSHIAAVDFISSTLFKCTHCNTRLQYPVMKVANVGNFCGCCIGKTKHEDATVNDDLHLMLKTLMLTCKYSARGCDAQMNFREISEHEATCDRRRKTCPFVLNDTCSEESSENLVDHLKVAHSKDVKVEYQNVYDFEIDLTKEFEMVKILAYGNEFFILRAISKGDSFAFFVYYVGDVKYADSYSFSVYHRGNNLLTASKIGTVLHDSQYTRDRPDGNATTFDLPAIRDSLGDVVETFMTVNVVGFAVNSLAVLECMECPVCNDFMSPEIALCRTGHSICGRCRKNLKRCPMCLGPFSNGRNYALESISALLKGPYECKYLCPLQKSTHLCSACCHVCPYQQKLKCDWHGLYKNVIEHLKEKHKNYTFNNSRLSRAFFLRDEIDDMVCSISYGYAFVVTTTKSKDEERMIVKFEIVGHKRADKYCYRLTANSRAQYRLLNVNVPIYSMNTTQECVTFCVNSRILGKVMKSNGMVITYNITEI